MRTRKARTPRKPFVPTPPSPPTPQMIALGNALDDVFNSMLVQTQLDLTAKLRDSGLKARVNVNNHYLTAEILTQDSGHVASFNVSTRLESGRLVLRSTVNSSFCDDFDIANHRFKALTSLMEVATMIQKTYVDTWSFET